MAFTALRGFPSALAGESANSKKLADAAPAANTATLIQFLTSTVRRKIQWHPLATNTTAATPGAATDRGFGVLKTEMNRTGAAPVLALVSAGAWTFNVNFSTTTPDAAGAAAIVEAHVYRRSATGVFTLLFSSASAGVSVVASGAKTAAWTSAAQSAFTFDTDETVHVEFWCHAQGVAATGNSYTLNIGANTWANFPLASGQTVGIVSNYPRSQVIAAVGLATRGAFLVRRLLVVTAVGAAVASRRLTASRSFAATAIGIPGYGRAVTVVRTFAVTAVGIPGMVRRLTSLRAFTTTAVGTTAAARRVLAFRSGVVTAVGSVGFARTVRAFRSATVNAIGVTSLARSVIAVRGFATTATTTTRLRLELPEAALDRIVVGTSTGPADYSPNDGLLSVAGVVRDASGAPVAGAVVRLHRQSDDFLAGSLTTAAGGAYAFARGSTDPNLYYVSVFLGGTVGGLSRRDLVPA